VSISIAFLRPLAQNLGAVGIAPEDLLRAVGIDDASSADTFVPSERVELALAQLGRRLGDPSFGLTLARISPLGTLGTFDYAVWASVTLR
jgi:Arabinose-binding domain of AraC transcription regulator, N-term